MVIKIFVFCNSFSPPPPHLHYSNLNITNVLTPSTLQRIVKLLTAYICQRKIAETNASARNNYSALLCNILLLFRNAQRKTFIQSAQFASQ